MVRAPSLLGFLRRWWLLLLIGPLIAAAVGYVAATLLPPVYQANATLLVTRGIPTANLAAEDAIGGESLARTYAEALKTRPVLEGAAGRINERLPIRELQRAVAVRTIAGTQLLRLSVEDGDPERAARLANAIVDVFSEQNLERQASRYASSRLNLEQLVGTLRAELDTRSAEIQQRRATDVAGDAQLARLESEYAQLQATYSESVRAYEALRIAEVQGLNGVTAVEPAVAPIEPIRPQKPLTAAIALVAGLVLAAGTAKVVDLLDDGIRTRERLVDATGLRPLGAVPHWQLGDGAALATSAGTSPAERDARRAAESYRLLFSTVMMANADPTSQPHVLMVTSAAVGEGKSVTAANLAAVLAEAGRRVILVDADLHRPSQMRRFGLPNRAGLSTLLINPSASPDSLLRETSAPGLRVLTSGPAPADPSALFTSRRIEDRLNELRQQCDVLVVDTPPVLAQPDPVLLGPHVDGVVFVVDARASRVRQVRRALELLAQARASVLGAALNRVSDKTMDYVLYNSYVADDQAEASEDKSASTGSVASPARQEA